MEQNKFSNVDEYILQFPVEVQEILQALRKLVKDTVPEAEEKISYQMPTYYLNGNLVHFAAYKKHIGFYPTPTGIAAFKDELSIYKGAKGSVQFPIDKPVPLDLIRRILEFRVGENKDKIVKKKLSKIKL
jgi:uncharacterized protein YdhG (YjbR/CyaY superfamily)